MVHDQGIMAECISGCVHIAVLRTEQAAIRSEIQVVAAGSFIVNIEGGTVKKDSSINMPDDIPFMDDRSRGGGRIMFVAGKQDKDERDSG